MSQTNALFDENDIGTLLRQTVSPESGELIERLVWGWLKPLLKVDDRPAAPEDWLFSAAVELGAIAYSNPEGLSEYDLEVEKSIYSEERRQAILRNVAGGGQSPDGVVAAPRGSFPPAQSYPDPAGVRSRFYCG